MTDDKTYDRSSGDGERVLLARIPGEALSKSSDLSEARAAPSEREEKDIVARQWLEPRCESGKPGCIWETEIEPV